MAQFFWRGRRHVPSDKTAPTIPTNLAGIPTTTTVALTWDASTDNVAVTGYNIYRDGALVGSSGTTSYTDTGLTASTTYAYAVSAFDAAGNESAKSTAINVTTSSGGSPPAAPGAGTAEPLPY